MMNRGGRTEKAFMDPVHGFIMIKHRWLLDLIDTPEFQRLRRLRQLGASFGTYHGAEHTRFGHSLGALHIMERILQRLQEVNGPLSEETMTVARAAALLHDVGHGPLSHALEYSLTPGIGHETWTTRILLEDTVIHDVLRNVDAALPTLVADVIAGRSRPGWVSQLVSSQLDVDRMDYLLRDALFTGAEYGRFQLDRIIHTLVLHDGTVAVRHKGMQAIEEYVLARHFMYWRVYFHKTIRGAELLLRAAIMRARRLAGDERVDDVTDVPGIDGGANGACSGPAGFPLHGINSVGDYLAIDDTDFFVALKTWARHQDPVLSDLSRRFLERRLLKPIFSVPVTELTPEAEAAARMVVDAAGYDADSYCLVDTTANVPYDPYLPSLLGFADAAGSSAGTARLPIQVVDAEGRTAEISALSPLINALAGQTMRAVNVYVPAECREQVQRVVAPLME